MSTAGLRATILVVEDQADTRRFVSALLASEDVRVRGLDRRGRAAEHLEQRGLGLRRRENAFAARPLCCRDEHGVQACARCPGERRRRENRRGRGLVEVGRDENVLE